MGRKNRRNKKEYRRGFGFDPDKYITNYYAPKKPVKLFKEPKRNEVWFARLSPERSSCIQYGCRPVFIISTTRANRNSQTLTVVPMTSRYKRPEMPTHVWLDQGFCVNEKREGCLGPSMLLAEQITIIDKSALVNYCGYVEDEEVLNRIEKAVSVQLGLEPNEHTATSPEPSDEFQNAERGVEE